jgi:PEP-CTERM motif
MTRPITFTSLPLGLAALGCLLAVSANLSASTDALSPWPATTESRSASNPLANALPVAGNKSDLGNEALGFFRVPTLSAHDPGAILYVGLRAEHAPTGSQYRAPLYSGSVESFRLGIAAAEPAPQTIGDIGEIFADDAPPTPMAYIVYRLDFSTRSEEVALFATPTVSTEPLTIGTPQPLDASYAWETIRFTNLPAAEDRDVDWKLDRNAGRTLAPEPTSAALLGLGILGFAARRRRA